MATHRHKKSTENVNKVDLVGSCNYQFFFSDFFCFFLHSLEQHLRWGHKVVSIDTRCWRFLQHPIITHTMHHVRIYIYTQINKTENQWAAVPQFIVPALCNLSCLGVEVSIQFSRRDHYQPSRCLLPRSCIVKTSKQVHTDRCIQIIDHQRVLPDIFTVLNQQTQRASQSHAGFAARIGNRSITCSMPRKSFQQLIARFSTSISCCAAQKGKVPI